MDWSRIKTIFIVAFLILDLFLASQLMKKHQTNQFEMKTNISFEENLKSDGIKYDNIPKEPRSEQYVSATSMQFTLDELDKTKKETVKIENDSLIHGDLETDITFSIDDRDELEKYIKDSIYHGESYEFWDYDEEKKIVIYYQKHEGRILFLNGSGTLKFYLDEDSRVESYEQTMLEIGKPLNDPTEVATALKALETLYQKGEIKPKSEVIKAELGYYTLVHMEVTQVLTPTWHFRVKDEDGIKHLLVNAYDLQIFRVNSTSESTLME